MLFLKYGYMRYPCSALNALLSSLLPSLLVRLGFNLFNLLGSSSAYIVRNAHGVCLACLYLNCADDCSLDAEQSYLLVQCLQQVLLHSHLPRIPAMSRQEAVRLVRPHHQVQGLMRRSLLLPSRLLRPFLYIVPVMLRNIWTRLLSNARHCWLCTF